MNSDDLALLGLLRRQPALAGSLGGPKPAPEVWAAVAALAASQGVAGLAHQALHALPAAAIPEGTRRRLREERHATALENLRHYGEFRRLARAAGEAGIDLIALKGLHLAELAYGDISLRPMTDMDVLVRRHDLQRMVALLQGMGYGFGRDVSGAAAALVGSKCNVGLEHRRFGIWLEVHWDIAEASGQYVPPIEALWKSAVPARLGDSDTRVLSPEFLLLHVCSHLAFNHTFLFSVRALCDIAQVIRSCPNLDWETVVREGRLHGWREGVAMALRLSRDHVGAEVPAEALGALGGNELEAEILADALQQVFEVSGIPGELLTAPNLLAVHGLAGAPAKAAAIWKRVFVPRDELSMLYGVPRQDARLPLYYGTRIRDLLRRYAASGWALNVSDRRLGATAARHERLVRRLTRA